MKRFCAVLCAFVLVIVLGLPVAAEGINGSAADIAPDIMAPAAYVVNLDTNIVVYEKNSETPLQAASLTKMMTTLLLLENYQDQLDTISQVRSLIRQYNPACRLEVDGGINPETARRVIAAGADTLVAGSAVYGKEDIPAAIQALRVQ